MSCRVWLRVLGNLKIQDIQDLRASHNQSFSKAMSQESFIICGYICLWIQLHIYQDWIACIPILPILKTWQAVQALSLYLSLATLLNPSPRVWVFLQRLLYSSLLVDRDHEISIHESRERLKGAILCHQVWVWLAVTSCEVRRGRYSKRLVTANHTHTWWYNMSNLKHF